MKSFQELIKLVKKQPKKTIAIVASEDLEVLKSIQEISQLNLASFYLFGDITKTKEIIKENNLTLPNNTKYYEANNSTTAAEMAVKCVNSGKADVLMKGQLDTKIILKAVLNKNFGLRTNSILSHLMMIELPRLKRIIFLTDAAMNIDPNPDQMEQIILNSVGLLEKLGFENPKVALISAAEKINPKIPSTIKCSQVANLFLGNKEMIVEGPLAVDLAINKNSAKIKNYQGRIQGDADILVVPTIEVGNALYKGWVFGCENVKNAGVIIGAKKPIVLTSRADSFETKIYSIALSLIM